MLGTTSILLRGIPFIYQGQEIGMTNCTRNDISSTTTSARRTSIRLPLTQAAAGRRHCAAATRTAGTMPERRCSGRMMECRIYGRNAVAGNESNYRQINVRGAGGADGFGACLLPETGASAQGGRLQGNIHLRYLRAGLPGNGGCICVLPCVRGERTAYTGRSKLWNGCGFLPLAYPCRQVLLSNLRAESAVETACEKANALTLESCEVAVIELG